LVLDECTVLELGAQQARVGLESLVKVLNSNAEMVDSAGDDASDATQLRRMSIRGSGCSSREDP
jgi:hypothetical protein